MSAPPLARRWALLGIFALGALLIAGPCSQRTEPVEEQAPVPVPPDFEEDLSDAVAVHQAAEGWRSPVAAVQVMGLSPSGGVVYVWVLVREAAPGGTAMSAPARIQLSTTDAGPRVEFPQDGAANTRSIMDLFPPLVAQRALDQSGIDVDGLERRARARADALSASARVGPAADTVRIPAQRISGR